MDIQFINITSYRSVSSNAEHYYASRATEPEKVNEAFIEAAEGCYPHLCQEEIKFFPDEAQARALCKKDNVMTYGISRPVSEEQVKEIQANGTIRFPSLPDLVRTVRETYPDSVLCFFYQGSRQAFFRLLERLSQSSPETLHEILKYLETRPASEPEEETTLTGDTTLETYLVHHTCLVEDLREAASLIERRRPLLAGSLRRYADELRPFDHFLGDTFVNPFKRK